MPGDRVAVLGSRPQIEQAERLLVEGNRGFDAALTAVRGVGRREDLQLAGARLVQDADVRDLLGLGDLGLLELLEKIRVDLLADVAIALELRQVQFLVRQRAESVVVLVDDLLERHFLRLERLDFDLQGCRFPEVLLHLRDRVGDVATVHHLLRFRAQVVLRALDLLLESGHLRVRRRVVLHLQVHVAGLQLGELGALRPKLLDQRPNLVRRIDLRDDLDPRRLGLRRARRQLPVRAARTAATGRAGRPDRGSRWVLPRRVRPEPAAAARGQRQGLRSDHGRVASGGRPFSPRGP